jgi:hypothetical protein
MAYGGNRLGGSGDRLHRPCRIRRVDRRHAGRNRSRGASPLQRTECGRPDPHREVPQRPGGVSTSRRCRRLPTAGVHAVRGSHVHAGVAAHPVRCQRHRVPGARRHQSDRRAAAHARRHQVVPRPRDRHRRRGTKDRAVRRQRGAHLPAPAERWECPGPRRPRRVRAPLAALCRAHSYRRQPGPPVRLQARPLIGSPRRAEGEPPEHPRPDRRGPGAGLRARRVRRRRRGVALDGDARRHLPSRRLVAGRRRRGLDRCAAAHADRPHQPRAAADESPGEPDPLERLEQRRAAARPADPGRRLDRAGGHGPRPVQPAQDHRQADGRLPAAAALRPELRGSSTSPATRSRSATGPTSGTPCSVSRRAPSTAATSRSPLPTSTCATSRVRASHSSGS